MQYRERCKCILIVPPQTHDYHSYEHDYHIPDGAEDYGHAKPLTNDIISSAGYVLVPQLVSVKTTSAIAD